MAISENASLRVSRQPESGGELSESADQQVSLPSKPLIKIRASKRWTPLDLREIWAHRELLYFLVWRDLKVRYKQTLLGVSWVVLQPILMTLVLAVFLGRIARVPSGNVPYVLFLYSGLLPWTFFTNAVSTSSHSLIASAQMITKVYFPRSLVPLAAVLVSRWCYSFIRLSFSSVWKMNSQTSFRLQMKSIVTVRNLSKTYHIGQLRNSNPTLRDALVGAIGSPLSFLRAHRHGEGTTLRALQDVSFNVEPGEVVGIIGRNGAGKWAKPPSSVIEFCFHRTSSSP